MITSSSNIFGLKRATKIIKCSSDLYNVWQAWNGREGRGKWEKREGGNVGSGDKTSADRWVVAASLISGGEERYDWLDTNFT